MLRHSKQSDEAIVAAAQRLIVALGDYFVEWHITESDLEDSNQELLAATNALDDLLKVRKQASDDPSDE